MWLRRAPPKTDTRDFRAREPSPAGRKLAGEIQEKLEIPNSTLSHHLDKLRSEGLVNAQRESTFLRYKANTSALQELLQFLYAECCTRNKAVQPTTIIQLRK